MTIARPKISGRSLIAASAADPVYATANAAPSDEPATAIAAPINADPFVELALVVLDAADPALPVSATSRSARPPTSSTPLTTRRTRSVERAR